MTIEILSDQLKILTLKPHQEVEKVLVQRLRQMKSFEGYLQLLKLFYSYFGALEERINLYISNDRLSDYTDRRKSAALAADILSLGGQLPEKIPAEGLPEIENHFQAFGALYVIEGSTLGGLFISQMIKKQLSLGDESLTFFQSYGDRLTTMWDSFKSALDHQAETEEEREMIISGAKATFEKFKSVLG
jgi:heme oxygenase